MTSYEALDRLEHLRRRYEGTRSTARVAIAEAIELAGQAIRDAELVEAARADGRIAEAERWREREQSYLETYRKRVRQLEDELAEKRRLREEREESGNEVQVKIARGLGGAWTIADLEEIVYRLRCGGGTDDTPVKVTEYTATANVVAPELVPLTRPGAQPPLVIKPPEHVVPSVGETFVLRRLALLVGIAFVLGVVLTGIAAVIL